jgi:peroxiredoxin
VLFGQKKKLLEAGAKAPDFTLPLLDGGETSLSQIVSGGAALLPFFKISCPVCQLTLPFLQRIHNAGATKIYGISQNDAADTRDFAQRYQLSFPILLDPEKRFPVSNAYGISSVPTMFLIDPPGVVSRVMQGWHKQEIASLGVAFTAQDHVPEWKAG